MQRLVSQLLDEHTILEETPDGASKKPSRSSKTDKTSQGQQKAALSKRSIRSALLDASSNQVALDTLVTLVDTVRIIQKCVGLNLSLSGSNDDLLNKLEDQLTDIDSGLTDERCRADADITMISDRLAEVEDQVADIAGPIVDELGATENMFHAKIDLKFEELSEMICERFDAIEARIAYLA